MKTIYLILTTLMFASCGMVSAFVQKQPPALTIFPKPQLVDIPVTKFAWLDDQKDLLVVEPDVIEDLGRNTARCLDVVDQYATQISAYNEVYAPVK